MDTIYGNVKILMLPWLAHGHISAFLEFAKKLTKKKFHIYLCSTPINLNSIKKGITEKYADSIELVELHLPSLPDLPPHYHTTNGLPPHLILTLKSAFEMATSNFSNILKTLNPHLVLYDFNQPWVPAIASLQNIPAVEFITMGVVMMSYAIHINLKPHEEYPFPEIYLRESDRMKIKFILELSLNGKTEAERSLEALKHSSNVVFIKSFKELEGKYIDYLSNVAGKKIVPVGPLVQEPPSGEDHNNVVHWLDKKDRASTIFVSFGSEYFLSKEEVEELAHGLELSKVNFIWVIRFPVGEKIRLEETLPEGFLERIGERGMVVEEWAPQMKILGHSSTGGFLSHCGWSSVMESMTFGVAIIAMPKQIDQPLNARLLEDVGVGVEIARDNEGRLKREEIAQAIRKVVVEKSGEDVRRKAREMSERMRRKEDEEIDEVVKEIEQLCGIFNKSS